MQEIRATRAIRNRNSKQQKTDRDEVNVEAKTHGYRSRIPIPIDEKTPKAALKHLVDKSRRKKIYEKLPNYHHGYSLEDVIAEKRTKAMAMKFYDDSMFLVSKLDTKTALNEDSLTEPSIGREGDPEVFYTVHHPSWTNRSGSQESKL